MTKEELEKRLEALDNEVERIWNKSFEMPLEKGWKWYSNHPKLKERQDVYRELKLLIDDYELSDLYREPNGEILGDLMTLNEFVEACKIGPVFVDSDGCGYYATATQESNISICPSDIIANKYRKDFTHVIWYNK